MNSINEINNYYFKFLLNLRLRAIAKVKNYFQIIIVIIHKNNYKLKEIV